MSGFAEDQIIQSFADLKKFEEIMLFFHISFVVEIRGWPMNLV